MTLSRGDHSLLSEWWFTIDRLQLYAICTLMLVGLIISLAASPSVAVDKGLSTFYFVKYHAIFAVVGMVLIFVISLQSPRTIRRISLLLYIVCVLSLIAVLLWGSKINGTLRWIFIFGVSFKPSEIIKPAFVVLAGWAFAETQDHHGPRSDRDPAASQGALRPL